MVSIVMSSGNMVRWPESVRVVLDTVGSLLSLSTYAHHFQCALGGTITLAQMYYTTLVLAVLLPCVFLVLSALYWFVLVPKCSFLGCTKETLIISGVFKTSYPSSSDVPVILAKITTDRQKRKELALSKSTRSNSTNSTVRHNGNGLSDAEKGRQSNGNSQNDEIDREIDRETNGEDVLLSNVFFRNTTLWKTTRDTWIISNVYWTFCFWPSILSNSFASFTCQTVCGRVVFAKDENEPCFGGQRETMAYAVALPAILLYLILLPSIMLYYLWKKKSDRLTRPDKARKIMFRFGLFFSGYAERRWFWEIFVVIRKIIMILIVTFGTSNEGKLHFALGFLMIVMYIQERERPYQSNSDRTNKNRMRSWLHLTEMISLIVLLIMLWVAELFNLGICKTATWNCVLLSLVVLGSNAVFVCVVFFLVLGSFAKNRSLVERCKSWWGGRKDRGGEGKHETLNEELELKVMGSNASPEEGKNRDDETGVQNVVNPLG